MFKTMLVEDNVIFRESLRDGLRLKFPSIEIIEVGNGEEALERIDSLSPNLIFMDIRLPGQSGLELTERIKTFILMSQSSFLPIMISRNTGRQR